MLSLVDQFLNVVTQTTRASTRKAGMLYRKRLVHLLRLKNCNPRPPDPGKYFSILVLVAKETRRAIWLFVSLFAFDSFPQYSTKSNQKHRNKKPNKKIRATILHDSCRKYTRCTGKFCASLYVDKMWFFCRGPPV